MWESRWDDIYDKNAEIVRKILEYNSNITNGNCAEFQDVLDITVYHNLLAAHIVALLIDNDELFVSNNVISKLEIGESEILALVDWDIISNDRYIRKINQAANSKLHSELLKKCFTDTFKKFIQEICAQDITSSNKLAKEISSILNSISVSITIDAKGEEEIFRQLSEIRNGNRKSSTIIQNEYSKEYTSRGALIYNRVFRHSYLSGRNTEKVNLLENAEGMLNFKSDNMYCQAAVLHIGVETTGSSGTGFRISEDGYALTCAHVVEGAKEICANAIVGDGYPIDGFEDFGLYDIPHFGEVIYTNKALDIALLKMEQFSSNFLPIEQRPLLPEIGDEVVVFGYPLGYEMPQTNRFGPNISFYKGYVSSNQVKDGNSITFLDIDVKSGNSGSPVISVKTGKVIGIISGIKVGGKTALNEKMPYMIPIQHFLELNK